MKINIHRPSHLIYELDDKISSFGSERSYVRGDMIYQKGEQPQGIYYITEGLVGLTDLSANGNEVMLRVFGHHFFFGHRSFIADEPYHATTICLKPTKLLYIPFRDVQQLCDEYPELLLHLTRSLAYELRIAEDKYNDLSGKAVMGRIIESLLFLKNRHPDYVWTRKEIGEFCGATTETVTRALTKLEKEGLITKRGREIDIHDENTLYQYSQEIDFS
jgi:CRP-like cAMP-binding protein